MTGASLEAVLTWQLPSTAYGYTVPAPLGVDPESQAEQTLHEAILGALGQPEAVDVVPIVVRGYPAATLLDVANGADLLVVGSRGHGEVVGMVVGSVSQHCVTHAQCPVVVVHHAQKAA